MDTIITFVDLPEDIVGYTDAKKSSARWFCTNANSSKNIILNDIPRTADAEVLAAIIFDPFSSSMDPLFHAMMPCCIHLGKFSYANCSRPRRSLAVAALLARIPMLTLSLKIA